ncbi:uncharacterized protein IUM83_11102 [Phytophthora cinnamomi]|uniref:uncharacterized protein n=1 Tax=Phytophthora cinnamomi TaxID=4785 RepID=UPI003559F272|nr:hypothetical protein IUM83_11102 [Phytophthora cinnamomi]
MSRILSASNTEQELFAVATGLDGSSNTAGDAHEYHLRENATIQVTEEAAGRVISWNSSVEHSNLVVCNHVRCSKLQPNLELEIKFLDFSDSQQYELAKGSLKRVRICRN